MAYSAPKISRERDMVMIKKSKIGKERKGESKRKFLDPCNVTRMAKKNLCKAKEKNESEYG